MSIDIRFFDFFNNLYEGIEVLRNIREQFNLNVKYDIGISKSTNIDKFDLIRDLIKTRFFSGIDLYGNEEINNFYFFKDVYELAERYYLKRKVHVGETFNSVKIEEALVLNPNVIQHGINIISVQDIEKFKDITFNVCVSSNLILGYAKSVKEHPIRKMYDMGLKVTINTDDQLIFGKSIRDEYQMLYDEKIFDEFELDKIRKNGLY